jgi:hypothetical protein
LLTDYYKILFSKPCQRQYKLLPSLGVRRLSSVIRFLFTLSSFKGEDIFWKSTNQKQEMHVVAMFAN